MSPSSWVSAIWMLAWSQSGMFPMSNRSPCNSTPLIEGSLRIASVSWSSPPTPGSVDSSRSKISDVRTSRPVIARFEGAPLRGGFSTKSETGKHACDWWSSVTFQQVLTGLPVGLSYRSPERGRRGRPDRSERRQFPFRLAIIFSGFRTFISNVYNATCSISNH